MQPSTSDYNPSRTPNRAQSHNPSHNHSRTQSCNPRRYQSHDPSDILEGGGDDNKLFIQLLDDIDNISGSNSQSIHRRRKAREIFSDWLFGQTDKSPELAKIQSEPEHSRRFSGDFTDFDLRKHGTEQESTEVTEAPFDREHSSRKSCGGLNDLKVHKRQERLKKYRPSSFHYPIESENESGYHTGDSMFFTCINKNITNDELKYRIEVFNQNNHGLIMDMPSDGENTFQGFIRVYMNLCRPIHMSISADPSMLYGATEMLPETAAVTTFHLPANTTKVIHISSIDTTHELIGALLAKFSITDNPKKFVLYEMNGGPGKKPSLRRMDNDECPLPICLSWTFDGIENLNHNKFVLQENDEDEIRWETFSLPELETYLNVLNREEDENIDQVKAKYRRFRIEIQKELKIKRSFHNYKRPLV